MGFQQFAKWGSMMMQHKAVKESNDALADASDAAVAQANAEINELARQREFVNTQAAEDKAERVRAADRQQAAMLVAMADMGGAGTSNQVRFAQEVGFYEGIDLARIEGNRFRQNKQLQFSQVGRMQTALNVVSANKSKIRVNKYRFLAAVANTAANVMGGADKVETEKPDTYPRDSLEFGRQWDSKRGYSYGFDSEVF